jgi:hypothetical protein
MLSSTPCSQTPSMCFGFAVLTAVTIKKITDFSEVRIASVFRVEQ